MCEWVGLTSTVIYLHVVQSGGKTQSQSESEELLIMDRL